MEYLSEKYDIELMKKQSKFEADYPMMMKRIEKLEELAHPKCGIDGFDGYQELVDSIEACNKKHDK